MSMCSVVTKGFFRQIEQCQPSMTGNHRAFLVEGTVRSACPTSVCFFEKNRSPDFSCILYLYMNVYIYMLPHFLTSAISINMMSFSLFCSVLLDSTNFKVFFGSFCGTIQIHSRENLGMPSNPVNTQFITRISFRFRFLIPQHYSLCNSCRCDNGNELVPA